MIFICLKYFCIDLSGLSRLGCPCLRLTDDDDDSRPAQMIPIALMIPGWLHHPLWSTFYNISISLSLSSPAAGACPDKNNRSLTPGHIRSDNLACVPLFFLLFIVLMKCKSNSDFLQTRSHWRRVGG